jgi:hypothetical protein
MNLSIRGLGLHEEPSICKRRNLLQQSARRRRSPRLVRIDSFELLFQPQTFGRPVTASAPRILHGVQESMAQRWCRVARTCHTAEIRGRRLGKREQKSGIRYNDCHRKAFVIREARGCPLCWTSGEQHRFGFSAREDLGLGGGAGRRRDGLRDGGKNAK